MDDGRMFVTMLGVSSRGAAVSTGAATPSGPLVRLPGAGERDSCRKGGAEVVNAALSSAGGDDCRSAASVLASPTQGASPKDGGGAGIAAASKSSPKPASASAGVVTSNSRFA